MLDAPAVLLETAFISHAREERLLKQSASERQSPPRLPHPLPIIFPLHPPSSHRPGMQVKKKIVSRPF